ncbi:MAG: hypothetical protein HY577_01225 [Candidatus Nealsonbacteria bacterium]|nr:hypothetical protein [Candidatus Nealsonbacteria bacterium]
MITPAPMPVIMPELYISFDPAMPSSRTVAPGRTNVEFVRLEFAAVGETVIRGLSISRKGGTDQDLQEVSLFDGSTQLSSSKRMDDGKTHFDGLNWVIPAYTVKTLTVKATISGTAAVGHEIRLGINSGKDINTDTNLDGLLFPIMGNAMTVR